MKIAITSNGSSLDDQVDPRFGRCAYFITVETETMDFEHIENPNVALGGGAGIQSAQFMAEHDVRAVLIGNCWPNAFQTLTAAGIEVIVGVSGTVRSVVERFKSGSLSSTQAPNVVSHFGMETGAAFPSPDRTQFPEQLTRMGRGIGGGRGMGRGKGRGMGIGIGFGQGISPVAPQLSEDSFGQSGQVGGVIPEQELESLKVQAQAMQQQLQAMCERISQIANGSPSRRLIAVVNTEKCTACCLCEGVCPVSAITMNTIALIDSAKCTDCGRCIAECPQGAVVIRKA